MCLRKINKNVIQRPIPVKSNEGNPASKSFKTSLVPPHPLHAHNVLHNVVVCAQLNQEIRGSIPRKNREGWAVCFHPHSVVNRHQALVEHCVLPPLYLCICGGQNGAL